MSKRVVLGALLVVVGAPMLAGATAPIGVLVLALAVALLVLPQLGRRATY